jgi:L-malate glycosyltransferase
MPNLHIYAAQPNVHTFYERADVLLNLSHPDVCVETFGMTILEAMYYAVPCIVPRVGGPIELVQDDYNGFQLSHLQITEIACGIEMLATNHKRYREIAYLARQKALTLAPPTMPIATIEVPLMAAC